MTRLKSEADTKHEQADPLTVHYRFDPGHSQFTVHAFATGLLSIFAHSPTFAIRDFAGGLHMPNDGFGGAWLEMVIKAASLELVDRVPLRDREDIVGRMRREVLEIDAYPEIHFEAGDFTAEPLADNQYQAHSHGRLTLHGVTTPFEMEARLQFYTDGIRLLGETFIRPSAFQIKPVTALGGTIRLKDELQLSFNLVGWKSQ